MTNSSTIKSLYKRLRQAGYNPTYIKERILPSWWDDTAAYNDSGFAQLVLILAQRLGLDVESLMGESDVKIAGIANLKFKKRANAPETDYEVVRAIATQAAYIIAGVTVQPFEQPASGKAIRDNILLSGQPNVGTINLTNYCWSKGIPVIYLENLPDGAKKPDGLAIMCAGRPVIVITKRIKYPAWLLFILAHELGHIVNKHLTIDGVIVDESVAAGEQSTTEPDIEEREANEFAIEVLTGDKNTRITSSQTMYPSELARAARDFGDARKINPGHVALNYAKSMNNSYAVGNGALKILQPNVNIPKLFYDPLLKHVDFDLISDDNREFLLRLIGYNSPENVPSR